MASGPEVPGGRADAGRGERIEDFIFGTFASDELKLLHARAEARGLQHAARITPADPLPGEPVTLTVTVGPDLTLNHLACYYTTDGTQPQGRLGQARVGQVIPLERTDVEWHPFLWTYIERWEGALPPQPEGTVVRYQIGGWREPEGPEVWADWPPVALQVERATAAFFAGKPPSEDLPLPAQPQPTDFAYSVDRLGPPDWAQEAVVYQVFVDRFNPGRGRPFAQPDSLQGFFGGTLAGVTERLDYIADLGATALWLSPIFASPTCHGYDTTDFYTIEPRLGTHNDLRLLVQEAHARGIRVILDLVCNHVSDRHPFFQAAQADPASPYRAWFTFDPAYPCGYRTFFNVAAMPRLNTAHAAVQEYLIGVARHYLTEYGVDGFRLDHANGPDLAFWTAFWTACKRVKPDCWCFGEVVEPPPSLSRFFGRLDGCLDFHLCDLLRKAFGRGTLDLSRLEQEISRHETFFPPGFTRPSFVDNHDMERFLYLVGDDRERLKLAALVQMTLPGPPIIYYGTEVGLSQPYGRGEGRGLEGGRMPMAWGSEQDAELLGWYRHLLALREAHPAIWAGERRTLYADEGVWAYQISEELLAAVNAGPDHRQVPVHPSGVVNRRHPSVGVGAAQAAWEEDALWLSLPPWSGGIWLV